MNIVTSSIKPFAVGIAKSHKVSEASLRSVYKAISNGFNATNNSISRITGLSVSSVIRATSELFNLGNLSRIQITEGQDRYCWGYTAIKPLRGDL